MPILRPVADAVHPPGHAFISYVREDSEHVNRLEAALEAAGIRVWRDTKDLWPGEDWRLKIYSAITGGSLAFLACFSRNSEAKESTHQSEEVLLAIEEMRRPAFARRSFRFFNPGMRRFAGRRFGGTF